MLSAYIKIVIASLTLNETIVSLLLNLFGNLPPTPLYIVYGQYETGALDSSEGN